MIHGERSPCTINTWLGETAEEEDDEHNHHEDDKGRCGQWEERSLCRTLLLGGQLDLPRVAQLQAAGSFQVAYRLAYLALLAVHHPQIVVCRSMVGILIDSALIGVFSSSEIAAVEVDVSQAEVDQGFVQAVLQRLDQ